MLYYIHLLPLAHADVLKFHQLQQIREHTTDVFIEVFRFNITSSKGSIASASERFYKEQCYALVSRFAQLLMSIL